MNNKYVKTVITVASKEVNVYTNDKGKTFKVDEHSAGATLGDTDNEKDAARKRAGRFWTSNEFKALCSNGSDQDVEKVKVGRYFVNLRSLSCLPRWWKHEATNGNVNANALLDAVLETSLKERALESLCLVVDKAQSQKEEATLYDVYKLKYRKAFDLLRDRGFKHGDYSFMNMVVNEFAGTQGLKRKGMNDEQLDYINVADDIIVLTAKQNPNATPKQLVLTVNAALTKLAA